MEEDVSVIELSTDETELTTELIMLEMALETSVMFVALTLMVIVPVGAGQLFKIGLHTTTVWHFNGCGIVTVEVAQGGQDTGAAATGATLLTGATEAATGATLLMGATATGATETVGRITSTMGMTRGVWHSL